MGLFGDFHNKKIKKLSKEEQAKKAARQSRSDIGSSYQFRQPEVISRGKKKDRF
jgi:hypothetical protein